MTVTIEVIEKMPEAAEAERIVLGSMLLDSKHLDSARVWLNADDFFLDSNRRIFRAMAKLDDARTACDPVTLGQYLQDSKEIQAIGGQAYISGLTDGMPRKISIDDYIKIVKEKSRLRRIIKIADRAINLAADQADQAIEIISGIQDGIQGVLDDSDADNPHVSAYTLPALDKFERDRQLDRGTGISFGLAKLDLMTGGMRDGEVCIVGARSGVGKTSFVCQVIADNCGAGVPCHFFSLEMSREKILHRLWAIVSGVPFARVRRPWLTNIDDAARIREAAGTVADWPLRIHDKADLHLSQICAAARISIRRHGSRFVAVDYAQEVSADGRDERTKTMAVARGLTRMIKHEPATLMLLSQLIKGNRDTYNTPPVVSDLIESGKLENVAHVVLLLHRGWDDERKKIADEGNIFVPKQREGDTGAITIKFNRRNVTFEEVQ